MSLIIFDYRFCLPSTEALPGYAQVQPSVDRFEERWQDPGSDRHMVGTTTLLSMQGSSAELSSSSHQSAALCIFVISTPGKLSS